jgi:nicotinamide-nucleotide amidase
LLNCFNFDAKIILLNIELLIIGDEILTGETLDTNSRFIANRLNEAGYSVSRITKVADKNTEIIRAADEIFERFGIIISTGGLGPTSDDITRKTLAEYFNTELVFSEDVFADIKSKMIRRKRPLNEVTKLQALVPASAVLIKNELGTAPGMILKKENKTLIAFPGVPYETENMVVNELMPYLKSYFASKHSIIHKKILCAGIPESQISIILKEVESTLPENIKLAYLPEVGIVKLRLTAQTSAIEEAENLINNTLNIIQPVLKDYIFGYDNDTLPQVLGKILTEKKLTISTAESCTGGKIASMITSIPGSSDYFKGSCVAYSNDIKIKILGVQKDTIERYGAVSEQTVTEMIHGIQKSFKTECAIATSGIAGPGGGTPEKPVGIIWIAVAFNDKIITKVFHLNLNRELNIKLASVIAMNMMRRLLI